MSTPNLKVPPSRGFAAFVRSKCLALCTVACAAAVWQSSSVAFALTPQMITFSPIATQTIGVPLNLTATTSSGLPVAFSSTTASVCTVSGTTATFLAAGTCSIIASQSGNATYAAAPSVTQSFTAVSQSLVPAATYDIQNCAINVVDNGPAGPTQNCSAATSTTSPFAPASQSLTAGPVSATAILSNGTNGPSMVNSTQIGYDPLVERNGGVSNSSSATQTSLSIYFSVLPPAGTSTSTTIPVIVAGTVNLKASNADSTASIALTLGQQQGSTETSTFVSSWSCGIPNSQCGSFSYQYSVSVNPQSIQSSTYVGGVVQLESAAGSSNSYCCYASAGQAYTSAPIVYIDPTWLAANPGYTLVLSPGIPYGAPVPTPAVQLQTPSSNPVAFSSANVCSSGQSAPPPCMQSQTLTYAVNGNITLGTPVVLTDGVPKLDFTLGSGNTCTGVLASGSTCSLTVNFTPLLSGRRKGAIKIIDNNGNVLSTTYLTGTATAPQIVFAPGVPSAVATAGLEAASAVAVDGSANLYIADAMSNAVVKMPAGGGPQTTVASGLSGPKGVAVDGAGNVYIADTGNNRVLEVPGSGGSPITLGSGFMSPQGVAVDASGTVYVADTGNSRIVEILTGNILQGALPASGLMQPVAVAVDAAGDVFIADTGLNQVVEVPIGGAQTTVGSGMLSPSGVAVDIGGNLFIADAGNSRVVEVVAVTGTQNVLSSGSAVSGVAVSAAGDVFVAAGATSHITELLRSQPPSLSLPTTFVGGTSSAQSVSIQNIGNAALGISGIAVGANFVQVAGSGTPADCTSSTVLSAGAACNLSISFQPTIAGAATAAAVLSDNALNGSPATQNITLSGNTLQSQTILFGVIGTQAKGTTLALSATATSALPVSFASSTPSVCSVSESTASFLAVGTCTITASQAGNSSWTPASVSQSFTVVPPGPSPVSISPSTGSGATQIFSAVYYDSSGTSALATERLLINSTVSDVNACYVVYYPSSNQLYLYNDAGSTPLAAVTPGSPAKVSNSQCTLSGTGSSYSTSGNSATLSVALTFAHTPPEQIYLLATDTNAASSDWVQAGTWGASLGVPVPVSVSPSSGSGKAQTFTAVYSDPNGAVDLTTVRILFNATANGLAACYVEYARTTNALYLAADSGQTFLAPVTPGSTTTVSNSQCTLSGSGSSYTTSGNTATLNVSLTFTTAPPDNIYLLASENNGSTSGWVQKGTWGSSLGAPTVVSLSPTSGSGTTQTFTAVASDPNGAEHLATVRLLFNASLNAVNSCYVVYYPGSNQLYLFNNAGTTYTAPVTPGSSATVSNSQCALSGTGSSYSMSGNSGTLAVSLSFTGTAPQNVYVESTDRTGASSGWLEKGTWGVSAALPAPVSVSPNAGRGLSQVFTAVYSDPNGAGDLATVRILINSTLSGTNACYVVYNRVTNGLYLANDAGALSAPILPRSTATATNSQCTLSGTGSSYSSNGNDATLTLALTFTASGVDQVYLEATENNGSSSGWVLEGGWTP